MAGHSKWNNIKHKKEKTDAQRGKIFTKIAKEISVAVKAGGADPTTNSRLSACIAKARANNMPNDNVNRLITKAAGGDGAVYEEVRYEGYGPRGVAVIVNAATDNRNRIASEMRLYFDKYGGNLGTTGCVEYLFSDCGTVVVKRSAKATEEAVMEAALGAGAEDFEVLDDVFVVKTAPSEVFAVGEALTTAGFEVLSCEADKEPSMWVTLDAPEDVKLMKLLLSHLEDNDDVTEVFHNWENAE